MKVKNNAEKSYVVKSLYIKDIDLHDDILIEAEDQNRTFSNMIEVMAKHYLDNPPTQ